MEQILNQKHSKTKLINTKNKCKKFKRNSYKQNNKISNYKTNYMNFKKIFNKQKPKLKKTNKIYKNIMKNNFQLSKINTNKQLKTLKNPTKKLCLITKVLLLNSTLKKMKFKLNQNIFPQNIKNQINREKKIIRTLNNISLTQNRESNNKMNKSISSKAKVLLKPLTSKVKQTLSTPK